MKRTLLLGVLVFMLAVQVVCADVPETISYQGLLTDAGGTPVPDGDYSLTFKLYDVETGGTALWSETHPAVAVANGIFNVILGSGDPPQPLTLAFDKQYWLEVTVGAGPELTPRIKLTSSAYSLNARSVADGAVTTSKIANAAVTSDKIGSGQVVKSINSLKDDVTLAEGANVTIIPSGNTLTISAHAWSLTGNAGTDPATNFLGTTDNVPLELRVNNARILRLEPDATSPNLIGGFSGNWLTSGIVGATISGGGVSDYPNRVTDNYSTVGGGKDNQAGNDNDDLTDAHYATVGGGYRNTASGRRATVGGGILNTASGWNSTVGGGIDNKASDSATVGGGYENEASGSSATIGGGKSNIASGSFATIGGGVANEASGSFHATVGGGVLNKASDSNATVGGGKNNIANAEYATIAGGGTSDPDDPDTGNRVTDNYGTVGGGGNNQAGDNAGTTDDAIYATVAGGHYNFAWSRGATVSGGSGNSAGGRSATVGGGSYNRALGEWATIAGGFYNIANAEYATIAGGGRSDPDDPDTGNRVTDNYGTVGGGGNNQAGNDNDDLTDASYATVGGGYNNKASGHSTTVGGGENNDAAADYATVGGGTTNTATGSRATIGGGSSNTATATGSFIGGGVLSKAHGMFAAVPGGYDNTAAGDYSLAAGRRARANDNGCFVWADAKDPDPAGDVGSTDINQFIVRATGGTYIYSGNNFMVPLIRTGVKLSPGASSWSGLSDRAVKRNIRPVDGREVLSKLMQVPISRWSYMSQDPGIEHIGPMAQDFYAAFGLDEDDKHINTIDPDGVALAAIQGLYELVQEKDAKIAQLEARLAALEALVK